MSHNPIKLILTRFNQIQHKKFINNRIIELDILSFSHSNFGFWAFMDLFGKSNYKSKFVLQSLIRTYSHKKFIRLYWIMSGIGVSVIFYQNRLEIYRKFTNENSLNQQNNENSLNFRQKLVIQEVLKKDQINKQLGKLIQQACEKPSVKHNVTKQINKLFILSTLQKQTHGMLIKLLREQVLYQNSIDEKLHKLIIHVLKQQKQQIKFILNQVIKSKGIQNITNEGMTTLISMQGTQDAMSNSLSSSLRDYLDNESTKNNLLRALENILSNK